VFSVIQSVAAAAGKARPLARALPGLEGTTHVLASGDCLPRQSRYSEVLGWILTHPAREYFFFQKFFINVFRIGQSSCYDVYDERNATRRREEGLTALRASQVCQYWRATALDSPGRWARNILVFSWPDFGFIYYQME